MNILFIGLFSLLFKDPLADFPDHIEIPTEPIPIVELIEEPEIIEEIIFESEEIPYEEEYIIEVSQADIDLMTRVVMSESGNQPMDAKKGVATVIVNRVRSNRWPNTAKEVIYQPNQLSTADNGSPTDDCYEAVLFALQYEGFPPDMYYFRDSKYHNFAHPFCQHGNMYFSTETNYLHDN